MKVFRKNDTDSEASLRILALFRVFYPLGILVVLIEEWGRFVLRATNLTCVPQGVAGLLGLKSLDGVETTYFLLGISIGLVLLSMGLALRWVGALTTFLFFWLIGSNLGCGFSDSLAYSNWSHSIVIFNLLILTLSPAERQFSLGRGNKLQHRTSSLFVFLLKFNLVYSYFAGGLAKLRHGLEWVNGYTLQGYLLYAALKLDKLNLLPLASHLYLLQAFSIGVLLVELLFPLVFINRWFSILFVTSSFLTQVLFWFLIDLRWMRYFGWSYLIYFFEFAILFLTVSKSSLMKK